MKMIKKEAPSWAKTGAAAHEIFLKEEERSKKQQEDSGKLFRFFMGVNEEARITFLDGKKGEGEYLDHFQWFEHHVQENGRWGNFYVCIDEFEPCPFCENDQRPYMASAFTVIDHRKIEAKNGTTYENQLKLFVCKRTTLSILTKIGLKRGGLDGITLDISRTGPKEPNVGNVFDFIDKKPVAQIIKQYSSDAKQIHVADYEKEITFRDGKALADLGYTVTGNTLTPSTQMPTGKTAESILDEDLPFDPDEE